MARAKTVTRNLVVAAAAVALIFTGSVAASASAPQSVATVKLAQAAQKSFTPKVSGSAAVGLTVKITGLPSGTKLTYQWKRNGAKISGATRSTYKVASADAGKKLTVTVTSKRSGYTTLTKTSAATAAVVRQFTSRTPTITGAAKVGSQLKATTAAWSPTAAFTYQWYRNGVAISGATAATRTLSSADAGYKITVKVTGRKSGYLTTTVTSAPTAAVTSAIPTPAPTPTPPATKPPVTTPPVTTPPVTTPPTTTPPTTSAFPVGARIDYQLGGAYTPPAGVGIVTRDVSDSPAAGVWNICYINGFQTQPGESGKWGTDLVLRNSAGKAVVDPDWPDEYLLDTSTAAKRTAIAAVLGSLIDSCATKGFAAVEFDNLDSYTRSGKLLVADHNIAMAKLLVDRAHSRGLLAGQKNTVELSKRLRDEAGFDFAVAEECVEYDECGDYKAVYGTKTLGIEYSDNSLSLAQVCADPQRLASTVYRDRDLVAAGKKGYVFGTCS